MRQIRADQGQVAGREIADMVANESLPGTFGNQNQLILRVKMPGGRIETIVEKLSNKRFARIARQIFQYRFHMHKDNAFMMNVRKVSVFNINNVVPYGSTG